LRREEQAKDLSENEFFDYESDGHGKDESCDDRHECDYQLHMIASLR